MEARDLSMDDITVGDEASFERAVIEADVAEFARLSGDTNPLHMDETYAATTKFGRRVVHGMFLGSLCSALVGMQLPGKRCLYLKQDLSFRKPVFIGETVTVAGTVKSKSESTGVLEIAISITRGPDTVAEGVAAVQVLPANA